MSIPESAVTPAEMQAWAAIFETSNTVQYAADRELRGSVGLSLAQFEILARIGEGADAARRMTDIADELTVSRSGLTYQVGQLEQRGLVERRPAAGDERSVMAHLTPAGRDCLADGIPGYVRLVREMLFDRISAEDLATVTRILGSVRTELKTQPKRSTFRTTRAPGGSATTPRP